MAKNRLGRGLDVLLPSIGKFDEVTIREIPIEDIDINEKQPRQVFESDTLQQLAQSISNNGIIAPIIVIQQSNRYQIVAGERRYRAARIAKLETIPCIVKELSDSEIMQTALIENIQREDLNPLDEAEAIDNIIKKFNYTQESIARILGKSRSSISNSLRILNLDDSVKKLIRNKTLSFGHAKVLVGVENLALQKQLAEKCIKQNLSVRELENAISKNTNRPNKRTFKLMDAEIKAFENDISKAFGLKTNLQGNANKGKIIISYTSKEELNNLYDIIKNL